MRRRLTSATNPQTCLICHTAIPAKPVTVAVTSPESYEILGFRAVVGIPCRKCGGRIWAVLECIMKGHQRFFREAWRTTLETEDFTPFEDVPKDSQEASK